MHMLLLCLQKYAQSQEVASRAPNETTRSPCKSRPIIHSSFLLLFRLTLLLTFLQDERESRRRAPAISSAARDSRQRPSIMAGNRSNSSTSLPTPAASATPSRERSSRRERAVSQQHPVVQSVNGGRKHHSATLRLRRKH